MATDVATQLPDVDLEPGSVLTVTIDDPAAVITSISVHGFQDDQAGQPAADFPPPVVLLAQQPGQEVGG